jgi:aspartyl-tRNA synthetase
MEDKNMTEYTRTHNCCSLTKTDIEKEVTLSGWVDRRRDHGGIIFIDLRDKHGLTQVVFDPKVNPEAHEQANSLRSEWVISVQGKVIPRSEGMANPKMHTGEIEVEAKLLTILSEAATPPFSICDDLLDVNEELRLRYRYLDIRRGHIMNNLTLRHKAMLSVRNYFDKEAFTEITTPVLCRSTPEGARDFLVPSRIHPENFYALPQSPQMFKQLLMISGIDRYFQICPCFRDEDLRAERQPEFTQIDVEMSFETPERIMQIAEEMLHKVFSECIQVKLPKFLRLTHNECLESYGTDKPDLRFDMPLVRLDPIMKESKFTVFRDQVNHGGCVKALCVKGGAEVSRREIDNFTTFVGNFGLKGLAWMKYQEDGLSSSITKFFSEQQLKDIAEKLEAKPGDLLLFAAAEEATVNQALDHLRRHIAKERKLIDPGLYCCLWVTDFPLLEYDPKEDRYKSIHHPFTMPHPDDIELLDTDPSKVRSFSYDVVINGYEVGGGSQRIHDSSIQEKIFRTLGISEEETKDRFGFFVEALKYGTPPHLGIAFGLDRLVMILCGSDNIRDVIAFPKTQKASDLMMECPAGVDKKQLDELHIATT